MVEKLKNSLVKNLKNYFSNSPKVIFVVMLSCICIASAILSMRKTIYISIDGKEKKYVTLSSSVSNVLKNEDITIGKKDKIKPSLSSKLKSGDKVSIKRAVDVKVAVDGKILNIKSAEDDVNKMVTAENIELENYDKVYPSRESKLSNGMYVKITRMKTELTKSTLPIDFSTVYRSDDTIEKGTAKTIQEGQQGEKTIETRIVYEDGKVISKQVLSEVVDKQPVNKIVANGTLGVITASRGGKMYYTKSLRMSATAYSASYGSTGKNPGDSGYGRTATGTRARRNPNGYSSIAVDPRVIPLGSKLFIEGYGLAIAEDTGSGINGDKIDLFLDTDGEANDWGVRWVNVYFLK